LIGKNICNKTVFVSGAGGSIGSELCRQILRQKPTKILLFDNSEYALYLINKELELLNQELKQNVEIVPLLGSIRDSKRLHGIFYTYSVNTIYHAAAYKHVPLVEYNVIQGVKNNIIGTKKLSEVAIKTGVENFVLISTDKAVRPTNIMGATKRFAELILQALAKTQNKTIFTMVRFGNVLGSSGSVVPLFKEQIRNGGPVTVTHKDITRYFMTIPEAAQLVIQAGALGKGGDVFVLDMGDSVKISELAEKLIHLMGFDIKTKENPDGEIEIRYTGLRPGEKLYEELLIGTNVKGTSHPRIMTADEEFLELEQLDIVINQLLDACAVFDFNRVQNLIKNAPTGYEPSSELCDLLINNDSKRKFQSASILDFPKS
jgi:FlaA1/EpsC-like NDP-sugar epimerase